MGRNVNRVETPIALDWLPDGPQHLLALQASTFARLQILSDYLKACYVNSAFSSSGDRLRSGGKVFWFMISVVEKGKSMDFTALSGKVTQYVGEVIFVYAFDL